MSRRSSRRNVHNIETPEVNLTPLIDVVFVILIMFIVIAPLLELDRVELANAPIEHGDSSMSVQENSPIAIHVRPDSTIVFNNRVVTVAQLPQLFKQAKKQFPGARPQLFHDRRGHFGVYQSIKNAAESAGYKQIDVVLKPA